MKLASVTMIRNEADVVEAFVRHNCTVVDEMLIVDHESVDGTWEMLEALADEGLPLRLEREGSAVHRQAELMTQAMRKAAHDRADWVLPLDADEFLVAPGGDVRAALTALDPDRPFIAESRIYVPLASDPPDEPNVLRRIGHRRVRSTDMWSGKVMVPHRYARASRFALTQGSHVLVDGRTGQSVPALRAEAPALAHYPVRSAEQLAQKVLPGWLAHIARVDRLPTQAFQWKRAFDAIVSGETLDAGRLEQLALNHATHQVTPDFDREVTFDPVGADFELRLGYTRPELVSVLARTAERLIGELIAERGAASAAGSEATA